jgi:hypothetical protein
MGNWIAQRKENSKNIMEHYLAPFLALLLCNVLYTKGHFQNFRESKPAERRNRLQSNHVHVMYTSSIARCLYIFLFTLTFKYYLKHEKECFIRNTRTQLECFISDKTRTASVLNGLQNHPSDEFIGEVILKINVAFTLFKL